MFEAKIMAGWKRQITQANKCYGKQHFGEALALYGQALTAALAVFEKPSLRDANSAVSAVVVSYLNLCDAHLALSQTDRAAQQFEHAHGFLQELARNRLSESGIQAAVFGAITQVYTEWRQFMTEYAGQCSQPRLQHYYMTMSHLRLDQKSEPDRERPVLH